MRTYSITKVDLLKLGLILFVALLLRIGDGAGLSHFRYDQATLSQLALEMAHGESIPVVGIESSVHVPNSPMTVYVLALPYFISDSPLFATIFVAVFNVIGVALLWLIAHRYFHPTIAILAALIYAVNPYAIYYSRTLWAQDYHTPIILFAIFFGFLGFQENRKWAQIFCLPVLIIGLQIHFAALTLLPIYLYFLWIGRKQLNWFALGTSFLLAILTIVPFAIGISQQPDGLSNRSSTIFSILRDGVLFRKEPLQFFLELSTGLGLELGNIVVETHQAIVPIVTPLWWGIGILTVLGLLICLKQPWRHHAALLWIWAMITVIVFIPAWTGSGIYRHYFIPSIPALALLAAIGLFSLIEFLEAYLPNKNIVHWVLYTLFALTLLNQSAFILDYYRQRINYTVNNERTATPLHYLMDVRDALQPYEDVIILGANPHESNYYVWKPMLYNTASCVRDLLINDGAIDILPNHPYAVLVAPLSPINADYVVPERYQHENPQTINLRPGEDPYIIYEFDAAPEWTETPIVSIEPILFETGIQLTGYYLIDGWMQLRWEVQELSDLSFQYFGHFLNEQGEKIGQRDVPFYVGQHWCEGDTLITTVAINLPPDTDVLRVGLYALDENGSTSSFAVVNTDGQEGGIWVDIPLNDEAQ